MASGQPDVQTFVLRVSIHCHGCKKKVRKVLKSIDGVHDVKVDAQQHKVMVTGTVDAETLVKRLYKSGKQALPWPVCLKDFEYKQGAGVVLVHMLMICPCMLISVWAIIVVYIKY